MKKMLLLFVLTFALAPLAFGQENGRAAKDPLELKSGKPMERELKGEEVQSYQIKLKSGEFLHVIADQRGIDVKVTVFGPDGKKLGEVDSPNGDDGPEPVMLVAETPGNYRIEVSSLEKSAPTGRYEIKISELRAATAQDKNRTAALKAHQSAHELEHDSPGNPALAHQALEKFEAALTQWRAAGDRAGEAETLAAMGKLYAHRLGEKQKGFDLLDQALAINRELKNQKGEFQVQGLRSHLYTDAGEYQKALEINQQSLALSRALRNHRYVALVLMSIGEVHTKLKEKEKALDFYSQSLSAAQATKNKNLEVEVLHSIAHAYERLEERAKAAETFSQALALYQASGNRRMESKVLNDLSKIYKAMGEPQKALDSLTQALDIVRAIGERQGEAAILKNLGALYEARGERQKALEYYNKSLTAWRVLGNKEQEADVLGKINKLNTTSQK